MPLIHSPDPYVKHYVFCVKVNMQASDLESWLDEWMDRWDVYPESFIFPITEILIYANRIL